jgi:hypothetical protein
MCNGAGSWRSASINLFSGLAHVLPYYAVNPVLAIALSVIGFVAVEFY